MLQLRQPTLAGWRILPFLRRCSDQAVASPSQRASHSVRYADRPWNLKPRLEYAGFWLRVWAGVIDVALEALVALLVTRDRRFRHAASPPRSSASAPSRRATSPASPSSLYLPSAPGCTAHSPRVPAARHLGQAHRGIAGPHLLRRPVVVRPGHRSPLHEVPLAVYRLRRIHDGRMDQAPPGAARHAFRLHRGPGLRTQLVVVRQTRLTVCSTPQSAA